MWAKLIELFLINVILPLLKSGFIDLIGWWKKRKAAEKKKGEVDDAVKKFKEADNAEDKKQAFKDLVRGTRRRIE